jgi:hypothetical protein
MGRPKKVDIEIEGDCRSQRAAMGVIVWSDAVRPVLLTGLPDNVVTGEPLCRDWQAV